MKWHHFGPTCDVRKVGGRFYHWNLFRYTADGVHLVGLLFCLAVLLRVRKVEGVSFKTQGLFLLIFTFRYLNLFLCKQFLYLVLLKATFWGITFAIVVLLLLGRVQNDKRDTFPVQLVLLPVAMVTLLLASSDSVVEVLWIFSQHLEGFAMLPQYIYCYRDAGGRPGHPQGSVLLYVLCLGGYRSLYGLSWMYKYFFGYIDISSWLSGFFNLAFFLDFLNFRFRGTSVLERTVLAVDDSLQEAKVVAEGLLFRGVLPGELHPDFPQLSASTTVQIGRPDEVEFHTLSVGEGCDSNYILTE